MSSINPIVQVAQQMLLGGAVKQNHALEHATIVLLSRKFPEVRFSGISFAAGFFVFGEVPTEAIFRQRRRRLACYVQHSQNWRCMSAVALIWP